MKPACQVCLVTKGSFLSGSSQVCRLCLLNENALNWSLAAAIVLWVVTIIFTFNFILAFIIAGIVFFVIRKTMRDRARSTIAQEHQLTNDLR